MKKEMVKLGRQLGNSSFSKMMSESDSERVFTLKSGAQARFVLTKFLHDDIEAQTFVDAAVNGRDQAFLTQESVSDISRTIRLQQFFPAIGREVDGRTEILDGSRRRAACLYNGTAFEVLVTRDALSLSDARQLAADIQTAREHTLRELGKRLKLMYPADMNQSDIAAAEGLSAAKVTRAFQAAAVPEEIIAVFPSVSELSISDYQILLEVTERAQARGISTEELTGRVRARIESDAHHDRADPTYKIKIVSYFRAESADPKKGSASKKVVTEKLAEFADKKQFARKKTDSDKRVVTYEFSRLSAACQAELDAAVRSVIERMVVNEKDA
ncbi:ParB/RepB/Spo0J family partition protein [Pantoea agglomerans]|uniref:ParB/RepB/Spo0J family partition protein n=1 Tax=Enterobacter agglomerans TaxID=549 RepID=UPI0010C244D1|nr:ParB family protein [Pantoea agglomerans]MBD8145411.1 ParB/RepB/Spo0J family partition protein [Pantoea agglomerans]MBD8184143.1 ParB/RepB/Spo0J family partition protein [Pantoea agglomerans]MBD8223146.1 ParB/RepB/Spo0J family partition protein [Pantoea agglomerans]TKJ54192.1 chromosome partitioning protein ParB [Pantoea agglomerans]TKK14536.1 chromosome partitioning protein ParB [Pantoea agglomerans]